MLYTIVPMEMIYQEKVAEPVMKILDGRMVEYRADLEGKYKPSRIISTDLKDYLKKL